MNFSPTRAMPIRSPHRRSLAIAATVLCMLWALRPTSAHAHEAGAAALPVDPGWQFGAAAAAVLTGADDRWPAASWPGVLGNGSAPRDQRGAPRLEHGTLDLAVRVNPHVGLRVAAGWHDRERVHAEAVVVHGQFTWGLDQVELRLGRDTVHRGAVIDGAGPGQTFSQPPLAQRAVLNDDWIDDGLVLAWQRPDADGLRTLEAGVWRGRAFPGGPAGPAVPSLHLHAGWGPVDGHLTAARFRLEGRGSAAQSFGTTGHVHGSLDCRASLQQRVCFDGTVDVLGASLQWVPEPGDWRLALAGLWRRERGALYADSGDAALRARISGLWADISWQPTPRWMLATRLERLAPSNRLEGIGTSLLSDAAGLTGAGPVERVTAAALVQAHTQLVLALEVGHERWAGGKASHVALRAIWRNPTWLGGAW
jgi:hypothetical protein